MAKAPTAPGVYWLALDEGGRFTHDMPLLVRVSLLEPYGEARIEFLDYPGHNPEKGLNPIIDEPQPTQGLKAFANGSLHRFQRDEVRLCWLGPVKPPKVPHPPEHPARKDRT
jgi:hypothetical protein